MQDTKVVEHGKELEEYDKLCQYTNTVLNDFDVETATRNDMYDLVYAKLKLDKFKHSGLHNGIIDVAVERTKNSVDAVLSIIKDRADIYTRDINKAKSKNVNKKKGKQLKMQNTGNPTMASNETVVRGITVKKMLEFAFFGGIMLFLGQLDSILKWFGITPASLSRTANPAAVAQLIHFSKVLQFILYMLSIIGFIRCALSITIDLMYIAIPAFRVMADERAEENNDDYMFVSHDAVKAVRECDAGVIISCGNIYSPDRVQYGENILKALVADTSYIKKIGKNKAVYERAQICLDKELAKFGKDKFDEALIDEIYNTSVEINKQVVDSMKTVNSRLTSKFKQIETLAEVEILVEDNRDTISLINKMHSLIETNQV